MKYHLDQCFSSEMSKEPLKVDKLEKSLRSAVDLIFLVLNLVSVICPESFIDLTHIYHLCASPLES